MKALLSTGLALAALLTTHLVAQVEEFDETEFDRIRESQMRGNKARADAPPAVDAAAIINESNAFLKEREPEMTAEEYALYEKIVAMLSTNSRFALRMLEGMTTEALNPSPAFEFILGNTHYSAGNVERAEKLYRSAVTRFPTFLRAWNNLGVLYYSAGRYAEAVPCFSRSVVLGDKEPMTFGLLGYCLERGDDVVSAEMAYMQALAGDPSSTAWKEGLLRIYVKGGQYGRAESLVRSLIKERPGDTRFWLAYANLLVKDGRKLRAMALLETAVQAGIAGDDELNLLGDLYAEHELVAEAVETYRRVVRPESNLGERKLLQFAQALLASRKPEDAAKVLDSLPKELPADETVTLLQMRADIAAAAKRWPEARRHLDALLAIAPMNGKAWISMGTARAEEGDLDRAEMAFEAALQDADTTYRAHLELANVHLKNRRYPQSVRHLEQALALKDTELVRGYLARIRALLPSEGESET